MQPDETPEQIRSKRRFTIAVLSIVAVLFLTLGIFRNVEQYNLGSVGVRTTATVTTSVLRNKTTFWRVEFTHSGQTITAGVPQTHYFHPQPGDEVRILYDPDNPHQMNVDNFRHRYFDATLMYMATVCCVVCIVIALVYYYIDGLMDAVDQQQNPPTS